MKLIYAADAWLHRVMRGRCWNRRLCQRISRHHALRDLR